MNDEVLSRLAKRLLKCPLDGELYESSAQFQVHLLEFHESEICRHRRVPRQGADEEIERPTKLSVCVHEGCRFAAPRYADWEPSIGIFTHIKEKHTPSTRHPPVMSYRPSDDSAEIDEFMAEQRLKDEYACRNGECCERFDDMESVARHWAKTHCCRPTTVELQPEIEADPQQFQEQFGDLLIEVFAAIEAENIRQARLLQTPDDNYRIRHMPSVPRVRSRPSEFIIYVERELVRLPESELLLLREIEGTDSTAAEFLGGDWVEGRMQRETIDLRFCNIVDGYIPLVEAVRRILPPLVDGEMIDVSWQADPSLPFPCKVSRSKRAIYNVDGRLKKMSGLHSGVRLYITRLGQRRYELSARRQSHTVPNCKFFVRDGTGDWDVEFADAMVEWETGDDVFRHQITFEEMDALHAEARRTNLSVRDAVHKVMERYAQTRELSVRKVHEIVFRFRTCSLAAVWAQFRPEHECYIRVGVGRYRFDPQGAFPAVRVYPPTSRNIRDDSLPHGGIGHRASSRVRILVRWSKILNMPYYPDQMFSGRNAGIVQARFIGSLIREFGPQLAERLMRETVSRHRLSDNPARDFVNSADDTIYPHQPVPGTNLFLSTNTSNEEKCRDIRRLVDRLGLSGTVEVAMTPGLSRAELRDSL